MKKAEQRALLEQEKQQLAYETKLTKQASVRNLIILGALGLAFLLFVFWRNNQRRKKMNTVLEEKNNIIQKALNEKDLLLREIHHRVKNNLQVISSLLALQSRYVADGGALSALKEGQDRVQSMALIHQDLYQADNLKGVDTQQYFEQLIESLFASYRIDEDKIDLEFDVDPLNLDVDTMIPLGLILNELISNSLKHAFTDGKKGRIRIEFKDEGDYLLLHVADNGTGINSLEDIEGKSFGFELIKAFAQSLNADMDIFTEDGFGVRLKIREFEKAA